MQWNSIGEFFAMGGYGLYVWGSFGACLILLVVEPILARKRHRVVRADIARAHLADTLADELDNAASSKAP